MSRFIQLHILTSYPPANLNRDDLGRPKTAQMGGVNRLRISSQSLKRAWRTSDLFLEAVNGYSGIRSKELGRKIYEALLTKKPLREVIKHGESLGELSDKALCEIAHSMASVFVDKHGKDKNEDDDSQDGDSASEASPKKGKKEKKEKKSNLNHESLKSEQLVFYSVEEIEAIELLASKVIVEKRKPTEVELGSLLSKSNTAIDLALFGRMLANSSKFNMEAAAQVAHAITVHQAQVEDDYFTAVDDLNNGKDDLGAAHIGESGFGAGVFYLYVCINRELLEKNLGDKALTDKALEALLHAITKVSPTGKQNSFASRAYASYVLAEKGGQQPRSLSLAFLKPVRGQDVLSDAIKTLSDKRKNMEKVYGACADAAKAMNAETGESSLAELAAFITE